MRAISNDHLKAAAAAIQQRLLSPDLKWCEELALAALNAAREVDRERGRRLAREVINPAEDR
jgi:hypothetical protein